MKKNITILFLLMLLQCACFAQDAEKRSIDSQLVIVSQDTSRALLLAGLGDDYKFKKPDSALFYAYKALALARQIDFPKGQVYAMQIIGITQITVGNDAKALQNDLQAIKIAEENDLVDMRALLLTQLGNIYVRSGNYAKALSCFREGLRIFDMVHDSSFYTNTENEIAETYLLMNQTDSALHYGQLAYDHAVQRKDGNAWPTHNILVSLGRIQAKMGDTGLALSYFWQSLPIAIESGSIIASNYSIAQLYQQTGNTDSCIYYAQKTLKMAQEGGFYPNAIDASIFLSDIYGKRDPQKALEYNRMAIAFKDSLYNRGRSIALENLTSTDEQERQYEIETATLKYQSQVKQYILLAGLTVFLTIAFILYWNNKQKQKANKVLEATLNNLKSTQAQLIQSEKMASLGELTAGIAHEIQNPLNFVNNFSEVNKEMLEELKAERLKPNAERDEVVEDELINDVIENSEKINHHGKRAGDIVKGMLQHSRSSTGVKEPTDINKLADEYLRLSYHGLRAKDKEFNAEMKTDFDETIRKINIIPQDIGRVLLNLFNNAFYAVNQQKSKNLISYEPTVSVTTKKSENSVLITVSDNGNGIPQNIVDKIFQPFFTTKPTGSGTGLGLSLSYDIVKAHVGEIKVESKEGEGTEFIIQLPVH